MNKSLTHIPQLDGLRGIAAVMIMVFHFFQSTSHQGLALLKKISVFGQTGVSLFFVLSGFLITRILIETKGKRNYFKMFYLKRTLRIFPLYYFYLLIFYFLVPLFSNSSIPAFNEQWYFWVYLQDVALTFNWHSLGPPHFWSLAVEEHFYLFWPLLIFYLDETKIKISIWTIVIISLLLRLILIWNGYSVFYFTFTTMDALAIGSLLAFHEMNNFPNCRRVYKFLVRTILLGLVVVWMFTSGEGLAFIQILKPIFISAFYFGLIGLIISDERDSFFNKIFKSKPLKFTGKISYGLYVYHPLIFMATQNFLSTGYLLADIAISFSCSFAISWLSYFIMEAPILALKNKFSYS